MTALFGGKYEPPGDASTLRAAKDAMWADHVEGKEPEGPEWNFWVRLAVLLSDIARGYEAAIAENPGVAVYYDQEIWVARNYLEMTGRTTPLPPVSGPNS